MTSEKIFSITGKEIPKEKPCSKNNDTTAETSDISKISYRHGLHVFTILIGCGLAMSILALIPRHNSVENQTYWFEVSRLFRGWKRTFPLKPEALAE